MYICFSFTFNYRKINGLDSQLHKISRMSICSTLINKTFQIIILDKLNLCEYGIFLFFFLLLMAIISS